MGQAQSRMRRLQASATAMMAGIRRAAIVTSAAFSLIFGAGLIAGGAMLRKIFSSAAAEMQEAQDRARLLTASFMRNDEIRKKGIGRAEQLVGLFQQQTEQLYKQGILSQDMLDNMVVQLARAKVPPAAIREALGPMADMLAVTKGIRATEEDATQFAFAWGKAINTGMVRPLQKFGIFLGPEQQKAFRLLVAGGNIKAAHKYLLDIAKQFKGWNARTLEAPGAAVAKMNQELEEMSERMGARILPLQDAMARGWMRILPWLESNFNSFLNALQTREAAQAWKDLKNSFSELMKALGLGNITAKDFGKIIGNFVVRQVRFLAGEIGQVIAFFIELKEQLDELDRKAVEFRKRWFGFGGGSAWKNRMGYAGPVGGGPVGAAPPGMLFPGVEISGRSLKKIQDERRPFIRELNTPAMQRLLSGTLAEEASTQSDQMNVLEAMVNRAAAQKRAGTYQSMEHMIRGGFYGPVNRGEVSLRSSNERLKQVQDMTKAIAEGRNVLRGMTDQGMFNEVKGYKEKVGEDWFGMMRGLPEQFQTAAFTAVPALQQGGIAKKHGLYRLAEHGSELVVPLRRIASAFSWSKPTSGPTLDDLISGAGGTKLGMLGRMGRFIGGQAQVTFAPNITINGNATEAEQHAMDTRLRELARDFIRQFMSAQYQERRLSYQGGYG